MLKEICTEGNSRKVVGLQAVVGLEHSIAMKCESSVYRNTCMWSVCVCVCGSQ